MTLIPFGMAVRGHLRQNEAGKPQAWAFWEPGEGEPPLSNPFGTTHRPEPGLCPFWPLAGGAQCGEGGVFGVVGVHISHFTSFGLEEPAGAGSQSWQPVAGGEGGASNHLGHPSTVSYWKGINWLGIGP